MAEYVRFDRKEWEAGVLRGLEGGKQAGNTKHRFISLRKLSKRESKYSMLHLLHFCSQEKLGMELFAVRE